MSCIYIAGHKYSAATVIHVPAFSLFGGGGGGGGGEGGEVGNAACYPHYVCVCHGQVGVHHVVTFPIVPLLVFLSV